MQSKVTEKDTNKAERVREQNRVRQANYRKRMKEMAAANKTSFSEKDGNSLHAVTARLNSLFEQYGQQIGAERFFTIFNRGGINANMPQIQNARIKAISSLPADYSKEDIGEFLRTPYTSEKPLRQTAEVLSWTAYPFYKIIKSYQDIPTYHYYFAPKYVDEETTKTPEFLREAMLIDKINKELSPDTCAHMAAGQSGKQGKVFYYLRTRVDKSHNKVDYAVLQQLPTDWCEIIGYNNVSKYTVSFNLMYFMQAGTDITQYGDLFLPYMDDFLEVFKPPKDGRAGKKIYASGKERIYYPSKIKKNAIGEPRVFEQNGRFLYYVSLPVEKVWTYELDDTSAAVASPFSGLMLTYSQQADYEAAQLSLLLNPLIKIFTGEIPYFNGDIIRGDDGVRLTEGARMLYEAYFHNLMQENNTGGVTLYSAPFQNIKSHDFPESANANDISSSFNRYGMEKAGLSGLIPVESDVKAGQAELSARLESRFCEPIYRQMEKMMNYLYKSLGLKNEWCFHMFGSIYTDTATRESAQAALANGDTSAYFILAALDGQSWLDKVAMMRTISASGLTELLQPPRTAYTQSGKTEAGRPESKEVTEGKEKSADSGKVEE